MQLKMSLKVNAPVPSHSISISSVFILSTSLSDLSFCAHLFNSNLACSVAKLSKGSNRFVRTLICPKKMSLSSPRIVITCPVSAKSILLSWMSVAISGVSLIIFLP